MIIPISLVQYILAIIAGFIVGFSLGLIGGGGSILAVPLLLYFVGLANVPNQYSTNPSLTQSYIDFIDHVALGTTALAVGLNAYINSVIHFKKGDVRVFEGIVFTIPGVIGATIGGYISHITPGKSLLFLFGILMIIVSLFMLREKNIDESKNIKIEVFRRKLNIHRLVPIGFLVGFASGYFGIGGGFLIVPGLIYSSGLSMIEAVGTSLISVGTFGITSAAVYSFYGYVLPLLSIAYLTGGIIGGYLGTYAATKLAKGLLKKIFAIIIIIVAIYIIFQNLTGIL